MASRAWSPDEVQLLEQEVGNDNWLEVVGRKIIGRSLSSVKVRMSRVRSDLGIKGKRGAREDDQDRANAKAVIATQVLLEATLRVGRWS